MPPNLHFGRGRQHPGPHPPQAYNRDVRPNVDRIGSSRVATPEVRVRNSGEHHGDPTLEMFWSYDTTGAFLEKCVTDDGDAVVILDVPVDAGEVTDWMAFPQFTVNPEAGALIANIMGHDPHSVPLRCPGCGVRAIR